ncbi:MAG: rod shape-determining protein MreC [Lentisphaeria bacterium]|nr:rod shape-determining protein MreC [Lentisphaeria bacterium]
MKEYPRKNRRSSRTAPVAAIFILILLIVLTSLFSVVRFAFSRFADSFFYPYMNITAPGDRLSDTSLLMEDKSSLAVKVEKLSNVNRSLALQGQAASELMEENRQLRNMLKLRESRNMDFIVAEILLRDPLNFRTGFTIDKGSRDGVKKGSAVVDVSAEGKLLLVGVVTEVGARTGKVMTIANSALHISGRVASNKEIGFTNTGGSVSSRERINFGMLPVRNDYNHSDLVSTTGFEQGIPPGIKIGQLYTINSVTGNYQQEFNCELVPAVRFSSLRFVAIFRNTPGAEL